MTITLFFRKDQHFWNDYVEKKLLRFSNWNICSKIASETVLQKIFMVIFNLITN